MPDPSEAQLDAAIDLGELSKTVQATLIQVAEMRDIMDRAKELTDRAAEATPLPLFHPEPGSERQDLAK